MKKPGPLIAFLIVAFVLGGSILCYLAKENIEEIKSATRPPYMRHVEAHEEMRKNPPADRTLKTLGGIGQYPSRIINEAGPATRSEVSETKEHQAALETSEIESVTKLMLGDVHGSLSAPDDGSHQTGNSKDPPDKTANKFRPKRP